MYTPLAWNDYERSSVGRWSGSCNTMPHPPGREIHLQVTYTLLVLIDVFSSLSIETGMVFFESIL